MFPSPYGVTVIKSIIERRLTLPELFKFPSPYGVTVIKSASHDERLARRYGVSVPLRGNGN